MPKDKCRSLEKVFFSYIKDYIIIYSIMLTIRAAIIH